MKIARRGLCLVLSAPSGAGKTAIAAALLAGDDGLTRSVSVTTRPRRPGEVDDIDYYFRDQQEFDRMRATRWARPLINPACGPPSNLSPL